MYRVRILILLVIIILNGSPVYSKQEDPAVFLNNIIEKSKPALQTKNSKYLEDTMEMYLDFNEVATWISGKLIWDKALKNDKELFLKELKKLMLRTYSKTVYYYIDSDVTFLTPKSSNKNIETQKRIQISSVMKKNNKNVNISYRLIKNNESWLVFDVIIEGISILKSLKSQYADMIRMKGLNYTSNKIKDLND